MIELPSRKLYFSPDDDCRAPILATVQAAMQRILVCAYAYTLPDLTTLLIEKHQAGLDVRLVLDGSMAGRALVGVPRELMLTELAAGGNTEIAQLQRLRVAGVPLITGQSSAGGIIHEKAIVADETVIYASYNFSTSAARETNHLVVDTTPEVVAAFEAEFTENWKRIRGEP